MRGPGLELEGGKLQDFLVSINHRDKEIAGNARERPKARRLAGRD